MATAATSARDLAARARAAYETDLGPVGAFLPERTPPDALPPPFARYADACLELPRRHPAACGGVRAWLDEEFGSVDPVVTSRVAELSQAELEALMTALSFLAHSYRWDTIPPAEERFAERQIDLPAGIEEPWTALASLLGQPRVGSLWAMVLCNWRLVDVDGGSRYDPAGLTRENVRVRFAWVPQAAHEHLERFVLTFVLLEARGGAVLRAIVEALEAAAREDLQETAYVLDKLAAAIEAFGEPLVSTIRRPLVDPQVFIDFLQPSWAWDAEGAHDLQGGPSGMQLGTLHALDAALGVPGASEFAVSTRAARVYLPERQRRFLEQLDEAAPILRRFVETTDDAGLKWRFNDAVRALRVFRTIHMKRGSHYLRAGAETGEGRVTTGLALEGRGDPVAEEFERLMSERIAETTAAAVAAPPEGAEPTTLETALRFLAQDEIDLLFEPDARRLYPAGEAVIAKGERRQALYVVRRGTAVIDAGAETPVQLGPGDVFGELSFLSNEGANASVVAAEELEVGVLERDRLYRLLERAPDLAGRFYHSLAVLVANRLRAARAQLASLRPEDVPARPRAGREQPPSDVRERVDALTRLRDERDVEVVCEQLLELVAAQGDGVVRAVGQYVRRRAYGLLAGSALLADALDGTGAVRRDQRAIGRMLANRPEGDDVIGVAVDAWALALPYCAALRAQAAAAAALAGELGAIRICSLETLPAGRPAGNESTVVAADAEVLRPAKELGVAAIAANVVHVARGTTSLRLPPQELVFTSGLLEYLAERDLVRLLDWIHAHLDAGGTAVVGTAAAGARDAAFWEHVLGWPLVRRSRPGLADAFARSDFGGAKLEVVTDEEGGGLLAVAHRSA